LDAALLFRAAANELLPVVIDLGPNQAKFSTFVSSVGQGHVLLAPVAAEFLPTIIDGAFRIEPAAGPADWYVTATAITAYGASSARVDLANARAFASEPTDPEARLQNTDLLVLVIPGGLHGSSSYVFPILRIGTDVCEIRSSIALEPGREVDCVEVVGDRRLLRRASAHVLATTPFYQADGGQSFCSLLSLGDELVDAALAHDLVTDAAEVKRLLKLAAITQARGYYEVPGLGRGSARLIELGKDAAWVEIEPVARLDPSAKPSLRLGFELFATFYELDVRPLQLVDDRLQISLPMILRRRRRHRRDHRALVVPPHRLEVGFRSPITGLVQTHTVTEVSFFGLSFLCASDEVGFWPGLPLEQAQLTWHDRTIQLGDLTVLLYGHDHAHGGIRCVVSVEHSELADDENMIDLVATLAHPHVRAYDGHSFASLHQMYLQAGLFGPHMERNLAPIVEQTQRVWRKLHTGASELVRTFVHGPEQAPDAAVTVMRAWEHAWVAQHFVDVSPQLMGATGRLQTAYLDHVVPRPDGRYLLFFVKSDNRLMNAYLNRFFDGTGTPDAVTRSVVELWSRPGHLESVASGAQRLRGCRPDEEVVVGRAAQRCLGAGAAAALSMFPGELYLPDTHARFAKADLLRGRSCEIMALDGQVAYAVLEERSTPGMNLTWMLNACWVLPVHSELDTDGAAFDAVLQDILERPAQSETGERFLNLPEGLDAERLHAFGFTKEASLFLYVLTRAGLQRFLHYTASRYGELDARTRARSRRHARQSDSD
jgi:hypothetical protein